MNAMNDIEKEGRPTASLDHVLHDIRAKLSPARVAAMQVLVHHTQVSSDKESSVPPKDFMAAAAEISVAAKTLQDLESAYLNPIGVNLSDDLKRRLDAIRDDLRELAMMTSRCSIDDSGKLTGFRGVADMYALCCDRVGKGVNDFSELLGGHFLELTDKDKAEDNSRTSDIAKEIGKIGRVINMVATNASIEAARAGDAGKGFTVIADEVKVLSSRVSSLSVSLTDRLNV